MANPLLNSQQQVLANELLDRIRADLTKLAGGDAELLFAYRRKVSKMLIYDERSGPMVRRKLKRYKMKVQNGLCANCSEILPPTYNVLDRFVAAAGYTAENVQLICETCDRSIQRKRRYT